MRGRWAVPDPVTVRLPSGEVLCECGAIHPHAGAASRCPGPHVRPPVPYVPGDATMRHRPDYVPADARYVPWQPRTYRRRAPVWARFALGLGVGILLGLVVLVGAVAYASGRPPYPGPVVTPSPIPTPTWVSR